MNTWEQEAGVIMGVFTTLCMAQGDQLSAL